MNCYITLMTPAMTMIACVAMVGCDAEKPWPGKLDEDDRISAAYYWSKQTFHRFPETDIEGVRIIHGGGKRRYVRHWLPVAELANDAGKSVGLRAGFSFMSAHDSVRWRKLVVMPYPGPELAQIWIEENGPFLTWSHAKQRLVVDRDRKRTGRPFPMGGIEVTLEPIAGSRVRLLIRNVGTDEFTYEFPRRMHAVLRDPSTC